MALAGGRAGSCPLSVRGLLCPSELLRAGAWARLGQSQPCSPSLLTPAFPDLRSSSTLEDPSGGTRSPQSLAHHLSPASLRPCTGMAMDLFSLRHPCALHGLIPVPSPLRTGVCPAPGASAGAVPKSPQASPEGSSCLRAHPSLFPPASGEPTPHPCCVHASPLHVCAACLPGPTAPPFHLTQGTA